MVVKTVFTCILLCLDYQIVLVGREILPTMLDQKDKVYFRIPDVTTWLTNNCNTHISQYLTK